jgi:hypothetical protein
MSSLQTSIRANMAASTTAAAAAAAPPAKNDALNFLSPSFDAALALATPGLEPPLRGAQPRDNISRCLDLLPPEHEAYRADDGGDAARRAARASAPPVLSRAATEKLEQQARRVDARDKAERMVDAFAAGFSFARRAPSAGDAAVPPAAATASAAAATSAHSSSDKAVAPRSAAPSLPSTGGAVGSASSANASNSSGAAAMPPLAGPLALLRNLLVSKRRVRVYVRRDGGVRGYCDAFVKAFDKHMNMVRWQEKWRSSLLCKCFGLLLRFSSILY